MRKRNVRWIIGIILLVAGLRVYAQETKTTFIDPQRLFITDSKTTNLIFPYSIKSIDRGSQEILVQKAIGVENVLQLKASKPGISETNLTVVTADGSLYSFLLNYTSNPDRLNVRVQNYGLTEKTVAVFSQDATTDAIASTSQLVRTKHRILKRHKDENYDMCLELLGLYVKQDVFYLQMALSNNSNINFETDQLRLFMRDRKKSKRTTSQENEIIPLHISGNMSYISESSEHIFTLAIPRFTMPEKKFLAIQLLEKNGGRNFTLKISNKVLMGARISK